MANNGTLTLQEGGTFVGKLVTLELRLPLRLEPTNSTTKNAPDFRVFSGDVEVGAVWEKTAESTGNLYYNMQLDDPSFERTIYAKLFQDKAQRGILNIVWDRARPS